MPRWKLRDPLIYPINFTETLIRASLEGSAWLGIETDANSAKTLQQRFCCFRYCLRNWPNARGHRAYQTEFSHAIRAKVMPHGDKFAVVITAKPQLADSLLALNPSLSAEIA